MNPNGGLELHVQHETSDYKSHAHVCEQNVLHHPKIGLHQNRCTKTSHQRHHAHVLWVPPPQGLGNREKRENKAPPQERSPGNQLTGGAWGRWGSESSIRLRRNVSFCLPRPKSPYSNVSSKVNLCKTSPRRRFETQTLGTR